MKVNRAFFSELKLRVASTAWRWYVKSPFIYAVLPLIQSQFKKWTFRSLCKIPERTQMLHSPFAYECRAFSRLIDVGQNGTWAVKCHGWLRLSADQFETLKPVATRQQISTCDRWAIVKNYIPNPFRVTDIPEICGKLSIPKDARIMPLDFHHRNFRESFFVDLGSTRTYPCPPFWGEFLFRTFYEVAEENVKAWKT
jgi:hypothetical protein